jgi:hypothetical protein
MPVQPVWPLLFDILRCRGRLQIVFLTRSEQWCGSIPELGVQVRCTERSHLIQALRPHVDRLPRIIEPARVNGHDPLPVELPAVKSLLSRR